MALFHFHVDQIGRSAGRSAVACAAYRSGEKLYSEYYGETSDYTRKGGVMYSEIMLPPHAPMAYADRQTLWNAVEKAERRHDAQLAYSFDIALQNELTFEENLEVARAFLLQYFVGDGMTVDFCVHDPERDGIQNPHFHVMVPIRPLNPDGTWEPNSTEFIIWTRMESASETNMETMCLMLLPPPTGANRILWNCGEHNGPMW